MLEFAGPTGFSETNACRSKAPGSKRNKICMRRVKDTPVGNLGSKHVHTRSEGSPFLNMGMSSLQVSNCGHSWCLSTSQWKSHPISWRSIGSGGGEVKKRRRLHPHRVSSERQNPFLVSTHASTSQEDYVCTACSQMSAGN